MTHQLTSRDLEQFADSAFATYLRQSPGASLALIVVRGDSVIFQNGYGAADAAMRIPVDPDQTVFNIASVSKLFVASAVMQLVDAGRIRLDDPVARHLPALRLPQAVTVRHLLTHTSGVDAPFMRDVSDRREDLRPLSAYFQRFPPRFGRPPGQEIRYSNYGMTLAARVVEVASGEQFNDYVDAHILRPLGMRSSTFRQPPDSGLYQRVAVAGAGRVPNFLLLYPAGAMVSTAADIGRFMKAQLSSGQVGATRIMSASAIEVMHRRQWSAHAQAPGVGLGFFESDIGGEPGLFHTGARTHFSLLYLLPRQRVGIFLVHSMRQGGPFQSLRSNFVRAFVARYFAREPVAIANQSPGAASRATKLAGVYRPLLLSNTTIERAVNLFADTRVTANDDGSLSVAIPAGQTIRVVERSPGVYRAPGGENEGLTIAFSDTLGMRTTRMSLSGLVQDPVSFDRLPWYRRGQVHFALLAATYAILVSLWIVPAVAVASRRIRRQPTASIPSAIRPIAARIGAWVGGCLLLAPVIAAITLMSAGEDGAADSLRHALLYALGILLAGVVLSVAMTIASLVGWRGMSHGEDWRRASRVHVAMGCVAAMVFVPLVVYYHLLPFWL